MSAEPIAPRWDPSDPEFRADPYPFYDHLRSDDPVHLTPDGMFVLTRYDDVVHLLRTSDVSRDIEAHIDVDPNDPVAVRRQQRSTAKTILNLDPPDHTRLRRLVSKAFTPRATAALADRIAEMTDEVLDRAERRGEIELIDELAFPIPFNVISELLGVPTDRADEMREWSQLLTVSLEPTANLDDFDRAEAALWQFIPHLVSIVNERREDPQDDLISALLAVEDDGDTLSGEELISFILLLYVAGHETTVNLIGNGMLTLLRHPEALEQWRSDPSLDERAIDELLRFDGPVQLTLRIPLVPMSFEDIDGNTVTARVGQPVMASLGGANRDPAQFDEPNVLRLDRDNAATHMSFGSGIHHCLGASLARLEATTVLARLIRRFPNIELVGEPHWRDRLTIRGVDRLTLKLG